MKIDIDIPDDLIVNEMKKYIVIAVGDLVRSYSFESKVKDKVRSEAYSILDSVIQEELHNVDSIREQVREALTKKLRSQLNAAIKLKEIPDEN